MLVGAAGAITIAFLVVVLTRLGVVGGIAAVMRKTSEALSAR